MTRYKRSVWFVALLLVFSFALSACGEKKLTNEERDAKNGTVTLSFAQCVYYTVGTDAVHEGNKKIVDIVKTENFAGDDRYFIQCETEHGNLFEIRIHGITGEYEVGSTGQYLARDYKDNLILSDSTGIFVHDNGGSYTAVLSGEYISASDLEEIKKNSSEADHNMYTNLVQYTPMRLDRSTIEDGIKEVVGHTVAESDYAGLEERIVAAYKAFEEAHPE